MRDAGKLKDGDALKQRLTKLAADSDAIRKKVVATKEGGAITGEERLREFLAGLYGDVNSYDGKPTDEQVARADVLHRELEDVIQEFNHLMSPQLSSLNQQLAAKKLQPITLITEPEWQKQQDTAETGGSSSADQGGRGRREID